MSERLATWFNYDFTARGIPTDELINAYKHWGEGEVGIILTGNTMIALDNLETEGNLVIPPDAPFTGRRFDKFCHLATESQKHGSLILAQVSHPGRQTPAHLQPNPISASDVQLHAPAMGTPFAKPRPATADDISALIEGFAHAAEYLEKAGFDGIQLHGAHGYLLSQFLSETTNLRKDSYGGCLANRMRIILEIREGIRKRVSPSFIVGIKINSVEFQVNEFQPDEALQLCAILQNHRFDFVELSGGTYEKMEMDYKRDTTKKREAFFMDFAEDIVANLRETKSFVTGGFRLVKGVVDALDTIDGIGLGRPICQEPFLCSHILSQKVTGSISQALDESDFGLTVAIACLQIKQMANDKQPINLGKPENVDLVTRLVVEWFQRKKGDLSGESGLTPAISGDFTDLTTAVI
ncbi:NADH oxidase [Cadophora sp. MPI-SDFR-AT-0126]|nr:NADH oxidase [Leotiomycetes sp. MPI-SDFR-AT-0126]